jgi:hypothetical protein
VNIYLLIGSPATLARLGQNGARKLHVPQWRVGPERPAKVQRSAIPTVWCST